MKIKLATWNVLADCYVKGQVGGQDSRGEWNSRSELMRATLVEAMSSVDVFCLQEVDHFDDFYSELFHSFGFCTIYMQRPTKNDGCLIAYRSDKFLVKHTQLINLDQLSHLDRQLQRTGRSKFAKQNVSAMAILEEIESRKRFLVATCHLHWNPNLPEVKFAQAYYVVDRISSFRECHKNVPVVFTGDFNSLPRDEVYRFIASPASVKATSFGSIELALASQIESSVYTYGPKTKFLCDSSLSRLCRWMRILGVDVAQDSWDLRADNGNGNNGNGNGKPMLDVSSPMVSPRMMMSPHSTNVSTKSTKSMVEHFKKQTIAAFFQRARSEKRVILTTSKGLLQRSTCPPSYFVKPGKLEDALVDIYREFGLELKKERFLTVCGKCGGEIEEAALEDPRIEGKMLPTDRQVFVCAKCAQPYWWSDHENSSPAKAMRQADSLYEMIIRGLSTPTPPPSTPAAATLPPPPPPVSTVVVSPECACEPVVNPPCLDAKEEEFIQHIKDWGIGLDAPSEADENELDGYVSEGHFVRIQSNTPSRTPSREHSRPASRGRSNSSAGQGQGSEQGQTRGEIVFPMKAQLEGEDSSKHHSKDSLGVRFAARNAFLTTKKGSEKVAPKLSLVGTEEEGNGARTQADLMLSPNGRDYRFDSTMQTPFSPYPRTPAEYIHSPDARAANLVDMRSVFGSAETEPPLTNWNGEFTGTLDYVFVTHDWKVESCRVAPTPLLGEEGNVEGRGINAEVRGSQPSEQWPSDHFMIITELAL